MIIYVIIYHIRNNKNCNIAMSIKYNTIITTVYQLPPWQKKIKRENMLYSIITSKYILNLSRQEEERKECITIIAYIENIS